MKFQLGSVGCTYPRSVLRPPVKPLVHSGTPLDHSTVLIVLFRETRPLGLSACVLRSYSYPDTDRCYYHTTLMTRQKYKYNFLRSTFVNCV
jgi:hypothetical protein